MVILETFNVPLFPWPRTITQAARWLEENRDAKKFLLWVELFDPHEPWDPPEKYYNIYRNPNYNGPNIIAPWFHSILAEDFEAEELENITALYAGEISLVDHWVGELVKKIKDLGLNEETTVIFTSDHGTMLGERGCVTKHPAINNPLSQFITNVPLIILHPDGPRGAVVNDLVWSPDFMPTCCELLGEDPPPTVHGRSFWGLVSGQETEGREFVISGWRKKKFYYVVDRDWRFVFSDNTRPDELYRIVDDPEEKRDIASQHPEVCDIMRERLERFFQDTESLNP